MHCALVPGSCAGTGSAWTAASIIGSQRYEAQSRHGAPAALARQLVEAGVPDDAVQVQYAGLAGCMSYRSLHAMALWTYSEGNSPLSRTRWQPRPFIAGEATVAVSGSDVSPEGSEEIVLPAVPGLSVTRACEVCGGPVTAKRTDATLCGPACKQKAYRARTCGRANDLSWAFAT